MTKGQIEVLLDQIRDEDMIRAPTVVKVITDYDKGKGSCGFGRIHRSEVAEVADQFDDYIEKLVRICMDSESAGDIHAAKALIWLAQEGSERLNWQQLSPKNIPDLVAPIVRDWIRSDMPRVSDLDATNLTFARYAELMRFCNLKASDVVPARPKRRSDELRERLEMILASR